MGNEYDYETPGQMTIEDFFGPPERLFAVSKIFARARKHMNLAEQKALVYALASLNFTEKAEKNYVVMNKRALADAIGLKSDADHLSVDLYRALRNMPQNSFFEVTKADLDFYASGTFITSVIVKGGDKERAVIYFNNEYLPLFTGLSGDYITMWSGDIFKMTSIRSVQFYEYLRQHSDTRAEVNVRGIGVKALKEMFNLPATGTGSYVRPNGQFNRTAFEKRIIDPICEDLRKCRMINLIVQPDGKYYEKVKQGAHVLGYRFFWTVTTHPGVATAAEVKEIQERVDKNPRVLKVAKDIVNGEKKQRRGQKNAFNDFEQHDYDFTELESDLLDSGPGYYAE